MTVLEAKDNLVIFFKELGMTKRDAYLEYIELDKKYKREVRFIIEEALKEYIYN